MDKDSISQLHKEIVNSIDYDDLSYRDNEGEWVTAISVQFKSASRYIESFKGANPFSVIKSWNTRIFDYLNTNNPIEISINGNIITAVFSTPKKSEIESVIYHAAYICSVMDLYNFVLSRKGIRTFDIGIGIYTDKIHIEKIEKTSHPFFCESPDLKSLLLSIEANKDGFERILIGDCTQFNVSDLVCYDNKKYSEVGVKRNSSLISDDVFGYNLNLVAISSWINEHSDENNQDTD